MPVKPSKDARRFFKRAERFKRMSGEGTPWSPGNKQSYQAIRQALLKDAPRMEDRLRRECWDNIDNTKKALDHAHIIAGLMRLQNLEESPEKPWEGEA